MKCMLSVFDTGIYSKLLKIDYRVKSDNDTIFCSILFVTPSVKELLLENMSIGQNGRNILVLQSLKSHLPED